MFEQSIQQKSKIVAARQRTKGELNIILKFEKI